MTSLVGIYLLAAASAPAGSASAPLQLTLEAASKLLVTDVQKPPHKLTLPAELAKPGWGYWGLYKICVDPQGKVAAVKVISGAAARRSITPVPPVNNLDQHWMEIVKGWRYRPHQVDGQARPFCYVAKLDLEQPYLDQQGRLVLSPEAGEMLRLSDIQKAPHRPTLPPHLNRAGMVLWGLYKLCLGANGQVTKVTTMKRADDDGLDIAWAQVMRTWLHKPYLVDGVPTPVCYVRRLEVRAESDD
jgi:hypothetical protein